MKKKDYKKWIGRLEGMRLLDGLRIGRLVKEKDEWQKSINEHIRLRNITADQRDHAEKENIALHNAIQAAEMAYEVQAGLTIKAKEERAEILKDFIQVENMREADLTKLRILGDEAIDQDKVIADLREQVRLLLLPRDSMRVRPICKAVVGLNCVQDPQCAPGYCQRQDKAEEAAKIPGTGDHHFCPTGGQVCYNSPACTPGNCSRDLPF